MATVITTSEDQDKAYQLLENYNKEKTMTGSYYYISVGSLHRMFTLWRFNSIEGRNFTNECFITNLSTDIVKAVETALTRMSKTGLYLLLDVDEVFKKRDLEAFETGKYAGEKIEEVAKKDPGYILFIANKIEEDMDSKRLRHLSKRQSLIYSLKGEMISIFAERRAEKLRGSKYIGQIGSKVSIKAKFDRQNSFFSHYGTTYMNTFLDEEGNVIIYRGKDLRGESFEKMIDLNTGEEFLSNDDIFTKGLVYNLSITDGRYHTFNEPTAAGERTTKAREVSERLQTMNLEGINANYVNEDCTRFYNFDYTRETLTEFEIGKEYLVTGTVKEHSDYREVQQTFLQRVKLTLV